MSKLLDLAFYRAQGSPVGTRTGDPARLVVWRIDGGSETLVQTAELLSARLQVRAEAWGESDIPRIIRTSLDFEVMVTDEAELERLLSFRQPRHYEVVVLDKNNNVVWRGRLASGIVEAEVSPLGRAVVSFAAGDGLEMLDVPHSETAKTIRGHLRDILSALYPTYSPPETVDPPALAFPDYYEAFDVSRGIWRKYDGLQLKFIGRTSREVLEAILDRFGLTWGCGYYDASIAWALLPMGRFQEHLTGALTWDVLRIGRADVRTTYIADVVEYTDGARMVRHPVVRRSAALPRQIVAETQGLRADPALVDIYVPVDGSFNQWTSSTALRYWTLVAGSISQQIGTDGLYACRLEQNGTEITQTSTRLVQKGAKIRVQWYMRSAGDVGRLRVRLAVVPIGGTTYYWNGTSWVTTPAHVEVYNNVVNTWEQKSFVAEALPVGGRLRIDLVRSDWTIGITSVDVDGLFVAPQDDRGEGAVSARDVLAEADDRIVLRQLLHDWAWDEPPGLGEQLAMLRTATSGWRVLGSGSGRALDEVLLDELARIYKHGSGELPQVYRFSVNGRDAPLPVHVYSVLYTGGATLLSSTAGYWMLLDGSIDLVRMDVDGHRWLRLPR